MRIEFKKLRFKNIMSYGGEFSEYNFENGIDIITGANGTGKSSFIEALTFALFGKPFRKVKIGSLVNKSNNKKLLVELIFCVQDKQYKIIRGIKPNIFEIYDYIDNEYVIIDQHSTTRLYQSFLENNILMFNENVFRQLIVLGANLTDNKNFMDLNHKEKEELFQIITDTTIFKELGAKIKERSVQNNLELKNIKSSLDNINSNIEHQENTISQMEEHNKKLREERDHIVADYLDKNREIQDTIDKLEDGISKIDELPERIEKLKDEIEKLHEKQIEIRVHEEVKRINTQNKEKPVSQPIVSNNIKCPSCGFEITTGIK